MEDFCKYVDVFYGNGEVTEFPEEGLASKWFFIKALCGNTIPHAVLPFGKMSVGAYSGGYPTGYGTHFPNSCGGINKLWDKMKIKGFSHLHQSGTGAIEYYYNYAVVTPFFGKLTEIESFKELKAERAKPGEYSAKLEDIEVRLTATHDTAVHVYKFEKSGGRVAVDFSNDGLSKEFEKKYHSHPEDITLFKKGEDKVFFKGKLSGVELYFCVKVQGKNVRTKLFKNCKEISENELEIKSTSKNFGAVFDFDEDKLSLKLSFSTLNFAHAEKQVEAVSDDFDVVSKKAYEIWNKYLSAIKIETEDEKLKEKFYSCFYHSLVKPCIMTGENVLGVKEDVVTDFATFWDQYKTLLPLHFMLYRNEGKKIADAIINISRSLGKIPCSFGLSNVFPCEQQAKMLGVISLCDAFHFGLCDEKTVSESIERELEREDYKAFLKTGFFERYTHILDVTDACLDVSEITGDEKLKEKLISISKYYKNAYGKDGLMSENSPYYEGDRFTYSFRLQANMADRIALCGGKESFAKKLDDFFGFGKESLKQITTTDNPRKRIAETAYHRFEGFNNECDMETPFSYLFADRYDRLCEISRACVNDSFKLGKGAIPGNNDSGGLSSLFMWFVLGIFPWAGTGKMLLGCPQIENAKITLSSGNTLEIKTTGNKTNNLVPKKIYFGGEEVSDYIIKTKDILGGGTLEFVF